MIIPDGSHKDKGDRTLEQWVQEESVMVAKEILQRIPPAVRQAMTTLDAIETGTQSLMRRIGRHITEALMAAPVPESFGVCRECASPLRQVDSRRARGTSGIFGDYDWKRPYLVCPQGHGSDAPQDRVLKLGPGQVSPKLAAIIARIAIDVPFDQVPDMLEQTLGLVIDGEMVRRVTEKIGSWAESQEQMTIQEAQSGHAAVPSAPGSSTLFIALDGAMVNTKRARHGHRGWHEGKVGVCARFEPTPHPLSTEEKDDAKPSYGSVDYCMGFEPQAEFLARLYAHALQAGLEDPSCRQIVLVADGAHWIWEQSATHLRIPGKTWVEILDFYHASQHIWAVANAVWPQNVAARTQWAEEVLHRLRHEGGAILDAVWEALPPLTAAAQKVVTGEQAYFTFHHDRLDYPRYRLAGFPIGSGIIESACKTVLKQRASGSGMRWVEAGAQAIATLRALQRSGHWQAFWQKDPWAQLVPPSRRIAA